jgi:hypothetical protein
MTTPGLEGISSRMDFEPGGPLGILPAALSGLRQMRLLISWHIQRQRRRYPMLAAILVSDDFEIGG